LRIAALLALTWLATLSLGLAQAPEQAPPRGENESCPVMEGEPVGEKPVVVEYQGRLINLCCKKCKRLFFEDPAKYLPLLPQFAAPQAVPAAAAGSASVSLNVATAAAEVHGEQLPFSEWIGRFHVVLVHFPIALTLLACWLDWQALARKRALPHVATRPLVLAASVSAVFAIVLGLVRKESLEFSGARLAVLESHELWAWVALAALSMTLGCHRRAALGGLWLKLYLAALSTAAIAVACAGHAGGRLTQGLAFFSRG
jgi:uncharacterized membrane protein